jgi:hypothetical protein
MVRCYTLPATAAPHCYPARRATQISYITVGKYRIPYSHALTFMRKLSIQGQELVRTICISSLRACSTTAYRPMKVEIGTEASKFSEKEYINGIFVAVCQKRDF